MTPHELLARIQDLPPETPRYRALEQVLGFGAHSTGTVWYRHQKEHWQGWLGEYGGPGAYGRKEWASRDAKYIWNHFQCVTGLFWMAEALELPERELAHAQEAVVSAPTRSASQIAALRRVFPWAVIEAALPPPTSGVLARIGRVFQKN